MRRLCEEFLKHNRLKIIIIIKPPNNTRVIDEQSQKWLPLKWEAMKGMIVRVNVKKVPQGWGWIVLQKCKYPLVEMRTRLLKYHT